MYDSGYFQGFEDFNAGECYWPSQFAPEPGWKRDAYKRGYKEGWHLAYMADPNK